MANTESQINNRAGYIFFFQAYWFIMSMYQGMMQFLPERTVLLKERSSGAYHLSAYFFSKSLSEMPLRLAQPFVFLVISYPMSNLNPSVNGGCRILRTMTMTILSALRLTMTSVCLSV
jgi:hypothetical protein